MPFKDFRKRKESQHNWYLKNRERILKERKINYQNQSKEERYSESKKKYSQSYYLENREWITKRNANWAKGNPKKRAIYARKSYHKNLEPRKAKHRDWMKKHPEKNRLYHFRRRVLCGERVEIEILERVYIDNIKKYGVLTCIYCKESLKMGKEIVEHLTPISRGGGNNYENLGIACRSCNAKKHAKTYEEFVRSLEPLALRLNPVCTKGTGDSIFL